MRARSCLNDHNNIGVKITYLFFFAIPFLPIELCVFIVVLDQRYLELASYLDQDRIFVGFVVHSSHH